MKKVIIIIITFIILFAMLIIYGNKELLYSKYRLWRIPNIQVISVKYWDDDIFAKVRYKVKNKNIIIEFFTPNISSSKCYIIKVNEMCLIQKGVYIN